MAQPTLVLYSQSDFTDLPVSSSPEVTGTTHTWVAGDVFHLFGGTEDDAQTISVPTTAGANLTLSLIQTLGGASNARVYYWRGTATGSGSGVFSATVGIANNIARGIAVWQYRASSGQGTEVTISGTTNKVIPITRSQTNSHVLSIMVDWNESGNVTITLTPSTNATSRVAQAVAGHADFFVQSWGDQSAAGGPTNYGYTGGGTVKMTGIAVEIFGTSAGFPPVPESPTMKMQLNTILAR